MNFPGPLLLLSRPLPTLALAASASLTIGQCEFVTGCLLVLFLLLAVHSQRKRMATEDAVYEEALVQKVGMQMKHVVFGIMAIIVFTILFALLKAKFLTWFFLLGSNVILFGYWAYLRFRKEGKVEVGGFRLFGDNDGGIAA